MNRYEYVTSVVLSGLVVLGAVAWTAASEMPAESVVAARAAVPAQLVATRPKDRCRRFSQFEFKLGRVNAPNCLARAN